MSFTCQTIHFDASQYRVYIPVHNFFLFLIPKCQGQEPRCWLFCALYTVHTGQCPPQGTSLEVSLPPLLPPFLVPYLHARFLTPLSPSRPPLSPCLVPSFPRSFPPSTLPLYPIPLPRIIDSSLPTLVPSIPPTLPCSLPPTLPRFFPAPPCLPAWHPRSNSMYTVRVHVCVCVRACVCVCVCVSGAALSSV